MALIVEISNSLVHGLPTEKTFIPFLVRCTLIFGPSSLEINLLIDLFIDLFIYMFILENNCFPENA